MASQLSDLIQRWCDESGVDPDLRPTPAQLDAAFWTGTQHTRVGAEFSRILSWERRFGFALPESLKAWLRLSDGFYGETGPLIHPLSAIGPMVPFSKVPGLVIQPESWFEIGNPNLETICIDLAYRWPGGDHPLFTSGDDDRRSPARIIGIGFTAWFLRLLHRGGAEYWFEPGFASLGDPWLEHRRRVPTPSLPERLSRLVPSVRPLVRRGLDDRSIASGLGLSPGDVEAILRHVQHAQGDYAEMGAESGA
jgi:hypothetical protein